MSDNTPRLKLPELAQMQELNGATINEALLQLDVFSSACFKGQLVNTPPTSPADGDTYLLGASPTGAWSGYAYKIAYCVDGAWRFYAPFDGLRAWDAGSGAFIVYQGGSWIPFNPTLSASETSVAAAATCDIGAAASLCVAVTGTTTITSFGAAANALRFVRFAAGLTLTHNATSLILPGGANIQTAAGDCCIVCSNGSGNWRCLSYQRAARPAFLAARTSSTLNVTGAGTVFQVGFNSTVYDRGGNFSSPGFTAPVSGIYHLSASVLIGGLSTAMGGGQIQLITTKRTYLANVKDVAPTNGGTVSAMLSVDVDMDAGDTATVSAMVSGGASDTADILGSASQLWTFFCGHLVA